MIARDQPCWLTVVVPVHRPNAWLEDTLNSIPADRGIAVVIRDSTPIGSAEHLIEAHRERLAIDYAHWPNVPSWTRKTNLGVEAASTEFVCTLHQDDFWLADRLDVIDRQISRFPEAVMHFGAAVLVDSDGQRIGRWSPPFDPGTIRSQDFRDRLVVQNSIAMPSPVIRRSAWLACGGLDDDLWYTPDWALWLNLCDHGAIAFSPEATTAFRVHGGSQTMIGDVDEMERQLRAVVDRFCPTGARQRKLARASVAINVALARAISGRRQHLLRAIWNLLALGPQDAAIYLRYSRLAERTLPRLRALLHGRLAQ